MAIRSGLEKCVFRKYHRKWTEKQIKPPPRFWRIGFSSSVNLARDTRSPLLSHAALPPKGSALRAARDLPLPPLGVLQVTCGPGPEREYQMQILGLSVQAT